MAANEIAHSADSANPRLYMFKTKKGTDLKTFEDYVKALPDEGNGDKIVFPFVPWQCYQTRLTFAQATAVATQPFVKRIYPIVAFPGPHDLEGDDRGRLNSRL